MRTRPLTLAALCALAACGEDPRREYAAPPWPAEHAAVVVPVDGAQRPVGAPRVFAPGAPVEVQLDKRTARLLVFTYLDAAADLTRCGVSLEGEHPLLPDPALAYRSSALHGDTPLVFSPHGEPPPALRYARCAPEPDPCPTLDIDVLTLPELADRDLDGITITSSQAVLLSTGGPVEGSPRVMALRGDRFEPFDLPVGLASFGFRNLHARPEGLWVTQAQRAWLLAGSGRVIRAYEAPFFIRRLVVGPDGPALAMNEFDEEGGLVDLTGALPSIDEPVGGAIAAGPSATFVLTRGGIDRLRGGAWATERAFSVTEGWQVMGGDAQVQVVANVVGQALFRSPDGSWIGRPLEVAEAFKIRVILPLGGDRTVVAGNDGGIALWTGRRWCFAPRSVVNVLTSGVASADGRTVYLGGADQADRQQDPAVVLRVTVGE